MCVVRMLLDNRQPSLGSSRNDKASKLTDCAAIKWLLCTAVFGVSLPRGAVKPPGIVGRDAKQIKARQQRVEALGPPPTCAENRRIADKEISWNLAVGGHCWLV
jgi:hypothetical protein